MSTLAQELSALKTAEDKITGNKVANFAYDDYAYEHDEANGVDVYNVNNHQNIPNGTANILKVNPTILTKGWRAQASAITRMLIDHFLGRCSYNLNKVNDHFSSLLTKLMSYLGAPNGIATLDSEGHLAEQTPVGSAYTPITGALLGAIFGRLLGIYWARTTVVDDNFFTPVYANGLWVCGSSAHGIWWSEDGKNWTQGTGGNTTFRMEFITRANGLWVCGSGDSRGIWWSEDGKAWTQGTGVDSSITIYSPSYINGLWVCTVNSSGLLWSEDGKDWTQATGGSGSIYSFRDSTSLSVTYANGIWVCCSNHGIWWSEDGKDWTIGTGISDLTSINVPPVYANGLWVCCAGTKGLWWSEDGKAWTQVTVGTSYTFSALIYAGSLWVSACREQGMWWSSDGKSWSRGTGNTTGDLRNLTYCGKLWLAGSFDTSGVWWSEDGKTWIQGTGANQNRDMEAPVYANGLWICPSRDVGVWRSEDGKSWTLVKGIQGQESTYKSRYVAYANGVWIASVVSDGLWYSSIKGLIAEGVIDLGADIPLVNS